MTNNLAYFASSSATNKKRFKTLTTVGKLCGKNVMLTTDEEAK
jgi:hypothetical protein